MGPGPELYWRAIKSMAKCISCGVETQLVSSGVPLCIQCDSLRESTRDRIYQILRNRVDAARQRRSEADARFKEVLLRAPGEIPSPDGAYRTEQRSREYRDALKAVNAAILDLNNFLLKGVLPPHLDLPKDKAKEPQQ